MKATRSTKMFLKSLLFLKQKKKAKMCMNEMKRLFYIHSTILIWLCKQHYAVWVQIYSRFFVSFRSNSSIIFFRCSFPLNRNSWIGKHITQPMFALAALIYEFGFVREIIVFLFRCILNCSSDFHFIICNGINCHTFSLCSNEK